MDPQGSPPEPAQGNLPQRPVREVLVVDDLPEITDFFRGLMRRLRDFEVHLATETDSQKALQLVRDRPFDLVVSDFRMRQVDGVEVLRAARERNPQGRRVLMTGYNEIPAPVDRIREASVDAYLQKPLKSQDLLLLIFDFLHENPQSLESCRRHARDLEHMAEREEGRARLA